MELLQFCSKSLIFIVFELCFYFCRYTHHYWLFMCLISTNQWRCIHTFLIWLIFNRNIHQWNFPQHSNIFFPDNGLVSVGNMPLPEPMVTKITEAIWHHLSTMCQHHTIAQPPIHEGFAWPVKLTAHHKIILVIYFSWRLFKWQFAYLKISFLHLELPFLAKSMANIVGDMIYSRFLLKNCIHITETVSIYYSHKIPRGNHTNSVQQTLSICM